MEDDIYRTLMKHLGEVGIGYPQIDDFLEVLKKTITPKEAEIALGLPTRLPPLDVEDVEAIAGRLKKPIKEVEEILEKLAQKGFLYKGKTPSDKIGFAFIQIGFGIPQIFFWKGKITDQVKEVVRPLEKYLAKGAKEVRGADKTRFYRYVPVNKAVEHALQAVLPFDMMTEVVKKARKIAVVHCPCRQTARILKDSKCTHSLEICIKFNKMAEFVLEKGLGREISQSDALDLIRKAEEEGLIHFVDNCQDEIQHNCNCCSCCCWNVMPIKKRLVPRDYIMATYYLRTTDENECISCGQCAQDCPLEIITMGNDLPVVDESVCIGCGVCLLHCPTGAAKLKRKDDKVPFKNFQVLHQTAIKNSISKKQTS
ncbi:MAG: 4Fe-4S binding protein [Thermodesulfobacteriota bacterium]|jgi:Pyruvate/2-oxoacid:ferredoxin oxidoreductase delta subunit/predicted transcriptional regulator|nr:MAG: 4Fe-4S binding protein [Thermodesulfobacteriota bacterium]